MPCDCSYMEPKKHEIHQKLAANIRVWLREKLQMPISKQMVEAANHYYGAGGDPEELCEFLQSLGEEKVQKVVKSNINDPMSGKLLDWWHEHKEYDKRQKNY